VWGSGDIVLDSAQAGVGMAVDMRIGEGAEVFLGNGVGGRFACSSSCGC
jgi:hypothetical protein